MIQMLAVNIGDALMRWSDDRLKSNYHRVRMPRPGEDQGSRYSIAYFNQVSTCLVDVHAMWVTACHVSMLHGVPADHMHSFAYIC